MSRLIPDKTLETCLVIATGMLLFHYIFDSRVFIHIAFGIGAIGIFVKPLAALIAWLWGKLGELLGMVVPRIILTAVYFVFLLPIALLYRLVKRDPLGLAKGHGTYWSVRNHAYSSKDLDNPW